MASASTSTPPTGDITPMECLILASTGGGQPPIFIDPVEHEIVLHGVLRPKAGVGGWTALKADKDGDFHSPALSGGYAYVPVTVPSARTMIMEANWYGTAYVNGEPHTGDVYGYGYVHIPVHLHKGTNDFLFRAGRDDKLHIHLAAVTSPAVFNTGDLTLPDLMAGQDQTVTGAVIVINTTDAPLDNLSIRAKVDGNADTVTPVWPIPPLSMRKVAFQVTGHAPATAGKLSIELSILHKDRLLDSVPVDLRVREPGQTYKATFISRMDGSVQYYAVNPASGPNDGHRPALFLSLHGASVEAIGQADAYSPKSWGDLVAPTNRRPYGFDWENWGRIDALEVLDIAQKKLGSDPARIYLTGHSMGGHGTWQVGALASDRFAAIGASAGWISFASYRAGGNMAKPETPMDQMLARASLPSDTIAMAANYAHEGVYILHGTDDDNVPVTEGRTMRDVLAKFHHDFTYYEQPGVGHWWDINDEPGADCVDWPPMFDMFARHTLQPDSYVRQVDFITPDPGVSSRYRWVTIEASTSPFKLSSVSLRFDPGKRRFVGTTVNVAHLALNAGVMVAGAPLAVDIDGVKIDNIPYPNPATLYLKRTGDKWTIDAPLAPSMKTPQRCGPFKTAFDHDMLFVYGTHGTREENAWAFAKARFDAEQFWYRGNGSIDIVADRDFKPADAPDRSVALYGNADTNSAWPALLSGSPIQVDRHRVIAGKRRFVGDDLACLFVRPRLGSDIASVGVVSGTGGPGMRLTNRQSYFAAGAGYPDCLIVGADSLVNGSAGVRLAGFFGANWDVDSGEFVVGGK